LAFKGIVVPESSFVTYKKKRRTESFSSVTSFSSVNSGRESVGACDGDAVSADFMSINASEIMARTSYASPMNANEMMNGHPNLIDVFYPSNGMLVRNTDSTFAQTFTQNFAGTTM
jgi:hypothetical protein